MQLASGLVHPAKVRSSDLPGAARKPASVSTLLRSWLSRANVSSATGTAPAADWAVAVTTRVALPEAPAGEPEAGPVPIPPSATAPPPLPSPSTPTAQLADRGA